MSDRVNVDKPADVAGEPVDPSGMKVIKRYSNRKLYDTVESRYVTLEEIAEMVKNGTDVKIVDNRTKEDLTSVTLAQIIFEEEKRESHMSLGTLRKIIQSSSGAVTDFIGERVTQVGQLREEAQSRVGRLFKRDEQEKRPVGNVRDVLTQSTRAVEDWQRKVDERVRGAVEAVTGLTQVQRDLARLHERLDTIEQKLTQLEGTRH